MMGSMGSVTESCSKSRCQVPGVRSQVSGKHSSGRSVYDDSEHTLLTPPNLHERPPARAAEGDRKLRRVRQAFLPSPGATTQRQNASASCLVRGWAHRSEEHTSELQ